MALTVNVISNTTDITTDPSIAAGTETYVNVNGALFNFLTGTEKIGSGTGTFDPFLATSDANGAQDPDLIGLGFNNGPDSGGNPPSLPLPLDVDSSKTRAITLSEVPVVEINGSLYYEFLLDTNESSSTSAITLETLKIYTSAQQATTADFDSTTRSLDSDFNLEYQLGTSVQLLLNGDNGSNTTNYAVYIPYANFAGVSGSSYVTLVTAFAGGDGGFEEWGINKPDFVPLPGLSIVKDADVATVDNAGDVINYTISVDNTGNVNLTGVTLSDPFANATYVSGDDGDNVLETNETWTYTASHTVTQAEMNSGAIIINTATADTDQTGPKSDDATTTVDQKPGFTIVKDADVASVDEAGDVIKYTIKVDNTGNVDLTGVTLSDPFATASYVSGDDGDNVLETNETWTYTASHTVTQAEMNSGAIIVNTATADTDQTGPKSDDATTTVETKPGFTIVKDADVASVDEAGDVIKYTIKVDNTGNVDLTGVTLSDPFAAATLVSGDDGDNVLETNETWTYTASHTVTQAEMNSGAIIVNTATADTDQTGPKSDDATTTVDKKPGFTIVKDADVASVDEAGDVIKYTIKVDNTGNVDLTGVTLSDPFAAATLVSGDDGDNVLEINETWTYTASHTVTQAEMNSGAIIVNTATADTDQTGPKSDDATTTVDKKPGFTIVKDADVASVDKAGDVIKYTIKVDNTGNVDLTGVTLSDPFAAAAYTSGDDGDGVLETNETWTYTASHTVTQAEMDLGNLIVNTATADTDQTAPKSDDATTTVEQIKSLDIEKSSKVADGLLNNAGDLINYTLLVTNTGNSAVSSVVVTDALTSDEAAVTTLYNGGTYNIGDADHDNKLDVSETWKYTASYVATAEDIASGCVINTAVVAGENATGDQDTVKDCVGPGVRTPGFWKTHDEIWNGTTSDDGKFAGKTNFPEGDILYNVAGKVGPALLIGDWNKDGITNYGEETICLTTSQAMSWLAASQKAMNQDARMILSRDVVSTWLNYLEGNPVGTDDGDSAVESPREFLNEAIDWLQAVTPGNTGIISGSVTPSSSAAWNGGSGYSTDASVSAPEAVQLAGSLIHSALDGYNNTGYIGSVQYAADGDGV